VLHFSAFPPRPNDGAEDEYDTIWQALMTMPALNEVHLHVLARDVYEITWMQDEGLRQKWLNKVQPLTERLQVFKVFLPLNERICGMVEEGPLTIWKG